jgi:hypothetical protein
MWKKLFLLSMYVPRLLKFTAKNQLRKAPPEEKSDASKASPDAQKALDRLRTRAHYRPKNGYRSEEGPDNAKDKCPESEGARVSSGCANG